MRIICPECHASYKVESVIKNAVLVCHKCNTEFDSYGNRIVAGNATDQFFKAQEENTPTFGIKDLMHAGMKKRGQHIWLWMTLVLLAIIGGGIASNWDYWSKHGLVRGYTLQVQPEAPILESDWVIQPESIQTSWLKRKDNSLALIIEGEVENLVSLRLPTPEIKVTFITQTGQNNEVIHPITEPASIKMLTSVPFKSPPIDTTPVSALGSRGFLLLVEDVPLSTQYVRLHALPVQRRGDPTL